MSAISSPALIIVLAIAGAGSALARQPATYTFRLTASPSNVGTCKSLDASRSRPHTLTVTGNAAVVKSNGGIDDDLKLIGPGLYRTDFRLARVALVVVADLVEESADTRCHRASRGLQVYWPGTLSRTGR